MESAARLVYVLASGQWISPVGACSIRRSRRDRMRTRVAICHGYAHHRLRRVEWSLLKPDREQRVVYAAAHTRFPGPSAAPLDELLYLQPLSIGGRGRTGRFLFCTYGGSWKTV